VGLQWRRAAAINGDLTLISGARLTAQIYSSTGVSPPTTYKYRFNITNPLYPGFPDFFGSTHGYEVNFVWNDPDLRNTTELSRAVDILSRTWVSFVSDLNPNHHGLNGVPAWEPYTSRPEGANFVFQVDGYGMESDTFRFEGIELINRVVLSTSH
jgi:acetylcholinesterase